MAKLQIVKQQESGTEAHAAVTALRADLCSQFAERDREVEGLLIAALAREHILLLGPPGTAKSALAQAFASALDGATFFGWLLTRFSTPEELFGPVSLSGLKQDRFTRVGAGKIQECHVAFLDEIFKANSAILNALLTALNERRYYDDGAARSMPLLTAVGASNELPDGTDLGALYDRFVLRYWVDYTTDPASFARVVSGDEPLVTARVTLDQWRSAQEEAAALPVSRETVEALFGARQQLREEGIIASDRRWRKCVSLMRAAAWLDQASEVTTDQIGILSHALWQTPEQAPKIASILTRFASLELSEAQEAFDAVIEHAAALPQDESASAYAEMAPGVIKEMTVAIERVNKIGTDTSGATKTKIAGLVLELEARRANVRAAARKALGL